MHNEASRTTLEYEFGTSNYRDVIFHILEKGELQENIVRTDPSLLTCYLQGPNQINHYPILQKIATHKTLSFQTSSNHRTTYRLLNDKESGTNLMEQEVFTKSSNETGREDDTDFHLTNRTCRSYLVTTNSNS